jgi:hypothetical protein
MSHPSSLALALAALIALPALPLQAAPLSVEASQLLARGGGRGGGSFGGSRGGGSRTGGSRPHSGFQGSGSSFSRGDRRPQGGFSSGDRTGRVGNPSLDRRPSRPAGGNRTPSVRPASERSGFQRDRNGSLADRTPAQRRDNLGDRNLDLGHRTINRGDRSLSIDRDWNRSVNIGDVNLNPGWARPGWGVARPWNWGWYGGWSNPPWGWWGARAAVWGIGTLATAAIINDAVNDAVNANQTYIVVPNTAYQLQYGTVQPSGSSGVSFVVTAEANSYQITADCQRGLINGRDPNSAAEAELLNAACQVAFGTGS